MAERNPYSAPALGLVSTFYSYKGGVGRTFALANIAVLLARWGHRVLCVDWDLEAPGLPLYFQLTVRQKINQLPGVVEMIQAFESGEFHPGEEYVSSVTLPDTPPFDLIVAGRQDANYTRRLQQLNWQALYESKGVGALFENLRSAWKQRYDFVLIDSRTGISDIGGRNSQELWNGIS